VSIASHWRGRSGAVCPMRVGVRKDGGQRTERFAGEEFGQKRAIPKCAPSEIVSSCSRPDSRKEPPPLFFPENLFFVPAPAQKLGQSRSCIPGLYGAIGIVPSENLHRAAKGAHSAEYPCDSSA
jgi:hypothetical protein